MSLNIINDHLFNDDEVAYLLQRNQHLLVEKNRREFKTRPKPKTEEAPSVPPTDVIEFVKSLGAEELNKELEAHDLSTEGSVKDRKIRLAKWMNSEK